MAIKNGLLALLADSPKHGYQLKLDLEATTGDGLTINVGQIYTTLQRLERDGLVERVTASDDGRVVYSVTDEGRQAVWSWMSDPVELAAAGRDEITLKILMAVRTGVEDPRRVVERQRGSTMSLLQDYTALKAANNDDDIAWLLHLDRLIYSAEAELRWLDRVEERLADLVTPSVPTRAPASRRTREGVRR